VGFDTGRESECKIQCALNVGCSRLDGSNIF